MSRRLRVMRAPGRQLLARHLAGPLQQQPRRLHVAVRRHTPAARGTQHAVADAAITLADPLLCRCVS
jgi:hypothetical protein